MVFLLRRGGNAVTGCGGQKSDLVILNRDTGIYFGLDETGSRMWGLLSSSASIQEAFDRLLDEYEVEPEILAGELNRFLEELRDSQLIEIAS